MKKIKVACIALLMMGLGMGAVNAQDKPAAKKETTKQQADKKAPASGQHLKKDGTPDMRYKENKQAATDKKPAATKTTTKSSTPKEAPAKKTVTKGKTDKAAK